MRPHCLRHSTGVRYPKTPGGCAVAVLLFVLVSALLTIVVASYPA